MAAIEYGSDVNLEELRCQLAGRLAVTLMVARRGGYPMIGGKVTCQRAILFVLVYRPTFR